MHEYTLMQELVERAVEALKDRGPCRVKEVRVSVGAGSGFAEENLRQAFEILVKDTALNDAVLTLRQDPGDAVILQSIVLEE